MKIIISLILSFFITKAIFKIFTIYSNKKRNEAIEYIKNEVLITVEDFFYNKVVFLDIRNINSISILAINVKIQNLNSFILNRLSIEVILDNKTKVKIMKKENVLILLKLLEKYNNYIFEQFFINKVFKVYGLKTMIKEELKKVNV